jgi:hypothetical protein
VYLEINKLNDLYNENYKTLKKEIKDTGRKSSHAHELSELI